jgi:methionine-rich copper-binding protein CopC
MATPRHLSAILLAVGLMLGVPAVAGAHAFLDHADPKVGSTIDKSPPRVTCYFTQSIEPAFSTLHVLDGDGKRIDKSDAQVDPDDQAVLRVSIPDLSPGTYKVEWKVTSVDTHKTHGTFTFTVKPKG